MRIRPLLGAVLALLVITGCGGPSALPVPPPADAIPDLARAYDSDPDDVDLGLLLASAYRAADRTDDGLELIARLRERDASRPDILAMGGLFLEDAGQVAAARDAYAAALAANPDGALAEQVERRLESMVLEALREDVRVALARESDLADAPDPATIGVFPFGYEGDDPQWEPLRLAMAELLATDLAVTGRLRLVERVKIQTLFDELALAETGRVEDATAARSGRILGSGRIVQGRFDVSADEILRLDASVVEVATEEGTDVPITAEDRIERLFELEKQLALSVYDQLGIQLTPAERARVNERQTESVQALLAFGRGLAASDAGDFTAAEQHYAEAAALDPGFGLASARRSAARAQSAAATRQMSAQAARNARRRQAVNRIRNAPASARAAMLKRLDAKQRAVLAEVLGQDRLGTTILLELTFRRPGGTP